MDASHLFFSTAIDSDVANGDNVFLVGPEEGNLVLTPAVSDLEGEDGWTTNLDCSVEHKSLPACQFLNFRPNGERGIALRLETELIAAGFELQRVIDVLVLIGLLVTAELEYCGATVNAPAVLFGFVALGLDAISSHASPKRDPACPPKNSLKRPSTIPRRTQPRK